MDLYEKLDCYLPQIYQPETTLPEYVGLMGYNHGNYRSRTIAVVLQYRQ